MNINDFHIEIDKQFKTLASGEQIVTRDDILHLIEWIEGFPPDIRQEKIQIIARIFTLQLQYFSDWNMVKKDRQFNMKIAQCINMIGATEYIEKQKDSYVECFRFLSRLNSNPVDGEASAIVQQYWSFQDILPVLKGLFLIENADGTKVYPIYEMIISMARDFQCDNDHLVNLAIALQMFGETENYAGVKETSEIREIISKIAEQYNIGFLKMLNSGGKLYFNETDYEKNGTLIVGKGNEFIIRNIKKEYFLSIYPDESIEEENQLAWYVSITLEDDEEVTDLSEIFLHSAPDEKLKLLGLMERQKIFNLFLPGRIVRKKSDKCVTRFLNQASRNDQSIVCGTTAEEHNKKGFLQLLHSGCENLRGCRLCEDEFDWLTIDFFSAFYLEVVKNRWDFWTEIGRNNGKNKFYQEWLIEEFLKETLKDTADDTEEILKDLYDFLVNYFDFSSFNFQTLMDGKLLAFPLIGDLSTILDNTFAPEQWKRKLFGDSCNDWDVMTAEYDRNLLKWEIKNIGRIKERDVFTPDLTPLIDAGENLSKENLTMFVNQKDHRIVYSRILTGIEKKIRKIKEISALQIIKYCFKDKYMGHRMQQLLHLMEANNFDYDIYEMFHCQTHNQKSVCLYKVLWHFQIFRISETLTDSFWSLLLKKHYLGMVENEQAIREYFNTMTNYTREGGTLVLAKESSGNDSTLFYLYRKFGLTGPRNYLSWAFDAGKINSELKIKGNKIYFNQKELRKIVLMVDNLMKGRSLKNALKYYIDGVDTLSRDYVRTNPSVQDLIKKGKNIEVEVAVIFGFEECVKEIENQYHVKVTIYNKIQNKYLADDETVRLVRDLYDENADTGICCVFRYNNQPCKSVLPEYILDSKKRGALFQRQKEI